MVGQPTNKANFKSFYYESDDVQRLHSLRFRFIRIQFTLAATHWKELVLDILRNSKSDKMIEKDSVVSIMDQMRRCREQNFFLYVLHVVDKMSKMALNYAPGHFVIL